MADSLEAARHARTGPARAGRIWPAGGVAVFAAALLALVLTGHTEAERSADEYGAQPLWTLLGPVAVGLLLVRSVPPRVPDLDPALRLGLHGRPVGRETLGLLACSALFVAAQASAGLVLGDEEASLVYPLTKVVFLLVVPLVLMRLWRPDRRLAPGPTALGARPGRGWRWGGLVAVVVYLWATVFSPWAPAPPTAEQLPPYAVTVVVMTVTFLTASVLEEFFYRLWLQSRLEVLFGRWAGIVLSALVFASMHVVSHGAIGHLGLDLAVVVTVQGTAGLLFGYLWSRYRNLWLLILLHGGTNALGLVPFLLGAA
ncbi:CPBP family intramembrane glutamic endopeptidase [Marinactinospora thermotolerans]|uniref:CPBP family intramembrane glutamic endopeptidase n=1 Tax=Marinactinospora thermotolerans TaxID=531310 RepID=UPI003D8C5736